VGTCAAPEGQREERRALARRWPPGTRLWVKLRGLCRWPVAAWAFALCRRRDTEQLLQTHRPGAPAPAGRPPRAASRAPPPQAAHAPAAPHAAGSRAGLPARAGPMVLTCAAEAGALSRLRSSAVGQAAEKGYGSGELPYPYPGKAGGRRAPGRQLVLFYGDHSAMWVREEEAAPVDAAAELEPEAARALRAWGRARRKCAGRAW